MRRPGTNSKAFSKGIWLILHLFEQFLPPFCPWISGTILVEGLHIISEVGVITSGSEGVVPQAELSDAVPETHALLDCEEGRVISLETYVVAVRLDVTCKRRQ